MVSSVFLAFGVRVWVFKVEVEAGLGFGDD